jgi:adenylate cyclase
MKDAELPRRLAVILAADVVGYSRLMQADEQGTLLALKTRRRDIIDPLLTEHQGRIFKTIGDGLLMEFSSAVAAVRLAVLLQQKFAAANEGLAPDDQIVFRIGINLGDVMVDGDDLFGDGVNIAARLEALAAPGGICISEAVQKQVRGKVEFAFEDIGPQTLKNMSEPVGAYRIQLQQTGTPKPAPVPQAGDGVSIAVLPFTNMSGDPEQAYFSDGITEDITTELSRFHGIAVVARHSSFLFENRAVDIRMVRDELGVRYVLEGSVRRLGERVRITAQLIDAATRNHLWAERFDRELADLFAVQDQVVRTIVGTVMGRIEALRIEYVKRKPPSSMLAYDFVLRGDAEKIGDVDAEIAARKAYEKAIELDPEYGMAYGRLAYITSLEAYRDDARTAELLDRALAYALNGVRFDETNSGCHTILGWIYLNRGAFDLSEQSYQKAIDLNPNDPHCIAGMAEWLSYVGRADEALAMFKQANLVNPHFNPRWWLRTLGTAQFAARQYEASLVNFGRSPTSQLWVKCYMAACCAYLGRDAEAATLTATILRESPAFSARHLAAKETYKYDADREHLRVGMIRAGLPD